MPNSELYKITATLQQKNNPTSVAATPLTAAQRILAKNTQVASVGQGSKDAEGLEILRPVERTVPKEAIYDRLNDGSYVAKFENYIGAEGNENRLAKEQSTGEKWGHGLTKMVAKAGTYAFDSVVGTAYGVGAAIGTGQWSKLYDNDFASAMDDVNKRIDNNFANYYSDEEKSMGVLQSMGTANFWANDVTGGLAFVGGAILPSIALGALTGGATVSAGAGKLAAKWGMNIAKKSAEEALEATGKSGIKNYVKTKLASGLGSVVDKGAFFVRTSAFEAGMEARQSYKTNVQDFYTKFEEQHGRMPTAEEAKPFLEDARNASNGVFNANLAILSVSNAVMFGKKILPTAVTNKLGGVTNQFNKAIGLGVKTEMVDGVLTKSMIQATKGQKILGNIYKIAKKPLTEGLYEEGFQGVTTKTAANYLDAKYNPQNTETLSLMANLADGFKEQYGSNEGWKEMAVGMIIGFGGGGLSPGAFKKGSGAFSGIGSDSRASTQKQMEADLKRANEGVIAFRNLNRTEGARAFAVTGADGKVARNYEDSVAGYNFIKSQEHISTPGQILEDHHKTIDAMEFQEPNMKEFLADRGVTEQEYKDSLKSSFETTLQQYRKATSHVKALGLDRAIKDTEGNKIEIGEAIVLNTMLGMSSLEESKKHLDQLDKLMGTSGTFDAHEFYQSLSEEQQDQIALLDKKTTELEELKKQAVRLGEQAAGSRPSTGQTSDQLNKQRVQTSEKAFQAQQAVIRVTQEIENLTKGLEGAYGPYQAEQRANDPNKLPQDINSVLNKLSAANNYVNSLTKAGETATTTAGTVKYLVGQAKYHSDAHREMVNMNRRMLSTNFFSSKEGKSFVGRILGKTYVMSDDLRKSIEDNDAFIDSSLRLMGQRGSESETVVNRIKQALEANPNLSEREKHRLEDLLRLQLTGNAAAAIVKDLTTASEQIAAMQIEDKKGDTVALAQKLKLKTEKLTDLDILTKAIDEITNELDGIINSNGKNSAEIAKLKEELQTLKEKRDAIEESNKQEEILNQQSSSSQREGTSSGQQEEGESEGQPGQTETNEADNSNSTVSSEAQQEIDLLTQQEVDNLLSLFPKDMLEDMYLEDEGKQPLNTSNETDLGGVIRLARLGEAKTDVTTPTKLEFLPPIISLKHLARTKKDKEDILKKGFDINKVNLDSPIPGIHFSSEDWGSIERFDRQDRHTLFVNISNEGLLYFDTSYAFRDYLKGLGLPATGATLTTDQMNVLKSLGVKGIVLRADYASDSKNELIVIDDSLIKDISESEKDITELPKSFSDKEDLAKKYLDSKKEGTNMELVRRVENILASTLNRHPSNKPRVVMQNRQAVEDVAEAIPSIEVLEENKSEIDSLIEQRIANYGLEPFDIFEGMSEADISIIERAKRGEAVDMNALQGTLDFIYKVYKDLVELKKPENSKDRLVKSLTLEYLEQVQSILEEDLEFLQTYKNANETGETLPTFEYSTESTVVTPTEGGATETITRVAPETTTQPTELEKIDAEIVAIENRIKKLEGERYQIIESQEYARFTQLSAKKEKGELTPNEEAELEELKDDLDKWTMITGVVIDGFRLSDLIEQKVVLESTPIVAPESVVVQETAETMQDVDIPDKTKGANTTFGNTYEKVIFSAQGTGDKKIYTIHHLTQARFEEIVAGLPIKTDRLDDNGNILLTAEEVAILNENTDLKIITDAKYSRASTVIEAKTMADGSVQYKGLNSDFNSELREGHDVQAVVEAEPGDEIEVFVDPKSDYNKFHLARIRNLFKELAKIKNNPTTKKNIRDKIKEEKVWLQENLQVMARINGRVVATFKGIREGVKNDTDLLFAEFRKAIVNDDTNLEAISSDTVNGVITVKVKGKDGIARKPVITVKQVLLGVPNYNYDQNAEGAMVTVFKPVPEQQQGKVIDIGYSLNGKTFTRDGKTVNTTFLAAMTKRNKTGKIPFVVLEVGGKRVAYPVRVETSKEVNTEEFEAIYNSDRSDSDKAKSLNRFMAANGIDIKEAGNAFISFGVTNLTDENFQNKLAQLKAINYFYNVEDWVAEDSDMKEILTNQITIDIDVENPFHSPKLMFDYSQLDLAKGKVTKGSTATQTSNNIDPEAEESSLFC